MPIGMTWQGLPAFLAALRQTVDDYKAGAQQDAVAAAQAQARTVRAVYQAHRRTGALAASVEVTSTHTGARVEATAKHAKYFEHGTRYMAGAEVFQPAARQAGAAMRAAAERRVTASKIIR